MIKTAIQSLLENDNSVAASGRVDHTAYTAAFAIFFAIVGTRIHAIQLPKTSNAFLSQVQTATIFFYVAATKFDHCHDGAVNLTTAVVRIHCVASSTIDVDKSLWAVGNMLNAWSGAAGKDADAGAITIQNIEQDDSADAYSAPLGASEFGLNEGMIELNVYYNNP